jgi:hypothetical protein
MLEPQPDCGAMGVRGFELKGLDIGILNSGFWISDFAFCILGKKRSG